MIAGMKSSRLLAMLLLLQTHERMTSTELARRFEVSPRTVLRDVEALSAAGIPVHTERGRGGAIVLDRRARLDPARLDPAELQLLTVAGLDADLLEQVGLEALGTSARGKLEAVTARAPETPSVPLPEVLLVDPSGWFAAEHEMDLTGLLAAARDRRRVRLRYRRNGETEGRSLTVDPYGLVAKAAAWYLVADVDGRPRLFNAGRIAEHQTLVDAAVLRRDQDLRSVWHGLVRSFEAVPAVEVHALLRASRLDMARRILGSRLTHAEAIDEKWASIIVRYEEIEAARQLLQFGDHIRVQSPSEAVTLIHDLATQLVRSHGGIRAKDESGRGTDGEAREQVRDTAHGAADGAGEG